MCVSFSSYYAKIDFKNYNGIYGDEIGGALDSSSY